MNLNIAERSALVTAATAGIGYAIACSLALEGVHVTITGRTEETVSAALRGLKSAVPDGKVAGIVSDCGTAQGSSEICERLAAVDILINNLGIYERKPFFEIADEDWIHLFEVNVLSGIRLARYYAPRMVARGWGRIVFVSSESALNIPKEMIHYGMTKTAQLSISRGLANELAETGVTVNCILPGPTHTPSADLVRANRAKASGKSLEDVEADVFKGERATSLIRRLTTADEVANMAVYLCGDCASGTTGAALRVDGGIVNQIM